MRSCLPLLKNGIAGNVRCVFYTRRFWRYIERLVATHLHKTRWWHAKKPEVKHRHSKSVAALSVHVSSSQLYIIIMRKEKAPIYKLCSSKAPKTQQICHYNHARKTSICFVVRHEHQLLAPAIIFSNSGSFAKISVPIRSKNLPKLIYKWKWSLLLPIMHWLPAYSFVFVQTNAVDTQNRKVMEDMSNRNPSNPRNNPTILLGVIIAKILTSQQCET